MNIKSNFKSAQGKEIKIKKKKEITQIPRDRNWGVVEWRYVPFRILK